MLQALLAGVASVKSQQTKMNVIGNNLANVNTTAYKSARVTFKDMISQTVRAATGPTDTNGGTNAIQYGLGVSIASTDVNNEQGSLGATNRPSDLAIQGMGYFMVPSAEGIAYSRDGAFDLDAKGNLVQTSTGNKLLGWPADAKGKIDTTQLIKPTDTLTVPLGRATATQATNLLTVKGNLNASDGATTSYTTQLTVFDALGGPRNLTMVYSNHSSDLSLDTAAPAGATGSWEWNMYEGDAATGTPIGSSSTTGNAKLYFDGSGIYVPASAGATNSATLPAVGGAAAETITVDLTTMGQLKSPTTLATTQNGFAPGSLDGYNIGVDGVITGLFSNGLVRPLGQIALANFANGSGLSRAGDNTWVATGSSGTPNVGVAGTGGLGQINSGFLEQSNVDISREFSDLIITQRGFQANTKIITTVDEMLQDLISMKR